MKKSKAETAQTRRRIVQTASEEFRENGIDATGLSELMAAAGLTHGGFYRHFESKAQLVAEACTAGMGSLVASCEAAASKVGKNSGLEGVLANYLSTKHRDNRATGCPLVALGSELARGDESTRSAVSEGVIALIDLIAQQYGGARPKTARSRAMVALSTMVGALTLSRLIVDENLSAAILRDAHKHLIEGWRPIVSGYHRSKH